LYGVYKERTMNENAIEFYRNECFKLAKLFWKIKAPVVSRSTHYFTEVEVDEPFPDGQVLKVTVEYVSESEIDPYFDAIQEGK
jgi:hypothetical protein